MSASVTISGKVIAYLGTARKLQVRQGGRQSCKRKRRGRKVVSGRKLFWRMKTSGVLEDTY